jgi:hypothetical protein
METERRCPFYRRSGTPGMGDRHGYCEFDCSYVICEGKTERCKKLESMRQYLTGREWVKVRIKLEKNKHYLEEEWKH